jgi:hypothetical protein
MRKAGVTQPGLSDLLGWSEARVRAAVANEIDQKAKSRPSDRTKLLAMLKHVEEDKAQSKKVEDVPQETSEPPPPPPQQDPPPDSKMAIWSCGTNIQEAALNKMRKLIADRKDRHGPAIAACYQGRSHPIDVNIEVLPLTQGLAERMATMESCEVDRKLDNLHIIDLILSIACKFIALRWAYAVLDGKVYRLNGQHSAWMFALFPMLIRAGMKVILEEYQVRSMEELIDTWIMFDKKRTVRKDADICEAAASIIPKLDGLRPVELVRMANTFSKLILDKRVYEHCTMEHRKVFLKYKEAFGEFFAIILAHTGVRLGYMPRSKMHQTAVMLAIHDTWEKDPEDAEQFWMAVTQRKEDMFPIPDLCNKLMKLRSGGTSVSNAGRVPVEQKVDPVYIQAVCCIAWNQWRDPKNVEEVVAEPVIRPKLHVTKRGSQVWVESPEVPDLI